MNLPYLRGLALILLAYSNHSSAQIIPISSRALVLASGSATVPVIYGGQSESYLNTSSGANFSSFTGSVSGDAFAEITILPPFELYLGTTLHAASTATQSTAIGADVITINSSVSASAWIYSQVGSRYSAAQSLTEITFRIDTLSVFTLSGSGYHYQSAAPYTTSTYVASLVSSNGQSLFQASDPGLSAGGIFFELVPSITGLLEAGTYTLRADLNALALFDPLGESGAGNVSLRLHVATVPDTGSTVILLFLSGTCLLMRLGWRGQD
jgi:hypothetical protein